MPPPRAVLFDLDDTLFDHRATSRRALAALRADVAAFQTISLDELERRHVVVLEALHHAGVMQGVTSVDEAREERFRRLLEGVGASAPEVRVSEVAATYRDAYVAARCAVPGARALLDALRPRVRLGIVSNNILAEQEAKLERLGMRPLIDVLVVSAEEGVSKPDPRLFQIALDRLAVDAVRAVMVGDSWATDILGALSAGVRAVWFNRFGDACPDSAMAIEIRSLEPADGVAAMIVGCL